MIFRREFEASGKAPWPLTKALLYRNFEAHRVLSEDADIKTTVLSEQWQSIGEVDSFVSACAIG